MDSNESPPPRERGRAVPKGAEDSSSNVTLLGRPKPPRQSTTARMLIGACWIGLMTKTEELDARGICTRRHSDAWRTRDPDEAVRLWRATSASAEVEIRITPAGRARGRGIEFTVALVQ